MNTILDQIGIENYIFLSTLLFSIGVFGVLYRRNAIIVFMSIEIMLNAVNLLFVAFSTRHGDANGLIEGIRSTSQMGSGKPHSQTHTHIHPTTVVVIKFFVCLL